MIDDHPISRISWTVIDQAVVSLGNFVITVLLARLLVPADYGAFALIIGGFVTMQFVNTSLVHNPLAVSFPVPSCNDQVRRLANSVLIVALLCLPLCLFLGIALLAFGRVDLVLPAIACFSLWQIQESMRRALVTGFRHKAAVMGDTISYLGQSAAIIALSLVNPIGIEEALYCMAMTSAAGALIQAFQLPLMLDHWGSVRQTVRDNWSVDGCALLNHLMTVLRHQIPLWALAAAIGPAAVAGYQVALNVVNLANPIIFCLSNIIPQTAALSKPKGLAHAWRSAQDLAYIGAPLAFGYYALGMLAPHLILLVFYGAGSPYLDQSLPVRLLVLAWCASYVADIVCAYLVGIDFARLVFYVNSAGLLSVAILTLPLSLLFGLTGACAAVIFANVMRVVIGRVMFVRLVRAERAPALGAA